ncbi:hypothetical protein CLIB1444_04S10044 [[Candida] jaroonii]|uniref:Uncharacterized protein n=1 Tax=[Candida] jaroonii TaxID=467808 RepID=A0ACA9Y7K0_9ASCO|nr:hypothetical protein CLIB1444_04S10044 [[Candida] jaroonii]
MIQDTLISIVTIIPNTAYYLFNINKKDDKPDLSSRSHKRRDSNPHKKKHRARIESPETVAKSQTKTEEVSSSEYFQNFKASKPQSCPGNDLPGGLPYIDIK